jgi:hypothetical protein
MFRSSLILVNFVFKNELTQHIYIHRIDSPESESHMKSLIGYETIKSLRQARTKRTSVSTYGLGSPFLLWLCLLGVLVLISFPFLGALETQINGRYNYLSIEGLLFGIITFAIVVTLIYLNKLRTHSQGLHIIRKSFKKMSDRIREQMRISGNISEISC